MRLVPCSGCRRHADALERACPFCGAKLDAPPARPRRRVGNLTRAAIFYFGASVASVGCSGPDEEPVVQPYGAPPDPPPEDTIAQPPEGDDTLEAPPSDESGGETESSGPGDAPPDDVGAPVPAYGVPMPPPEPPADDRAHTPEGGDALPEIDPGSQAGAYGAPPGGF